MKPPLLVQLLLMLLGFVAPLVAVHAAAADEIAVRGVKGFSDQSASAVATTQLSDDFRACVFGDELTVIIPGVPRGPLTLEMDFASAPDAKKGKRVMAVTCDGAVLTARLDIVAEGGAGKPLTKSFSVTHEGDQPLNVALVAIAGSAEFCNIRVRDAGGKILAVVTARKYQAIDPAAVSPEFRRLNADELTFFNEDHCPEGAYAGLLYGAKGQYGGFEVGPNRVPQDGLIIATKDSAGVRLMPFIRKQFVDAKAQWFADADIHRKIRACTDRWTAPGLSWVHYSPSWYLADINTASDAERKRFCLPATWMEFEIDNTAGTAPRNFYLAMPVAAEQQQFVGGKFEGFSIGQHSIAVEKGVCDLLSGDALKAHLGKVAKGFGFHATVPAGQRKTVRFIIAHYRSDVTCEDLNARMYYTSLYSSLDDVIATADAGFSSAKARCERLDELLEKSGQNPYRQFLAGHALHTYRASTYLLIDEKHTPIWAELEGGYNMINTFDLTVDHLFYNMAMHPWATRNVIDHFADAYTLDLPLQDPKTKQKVGGGGISFHHDMGVGTVYVKPGSLSGYETRMSVMGQEELQNWILCAGQYWKTTGDGAWLGRRHEILGKCLQSMLVRDDTDATKRDGITTYVNTNGRNEEITTYDSIDSSLRVPRENGYITVKSWATYLTLERLFHELGDDAQASAARAEAGLCAKSIVAHFDDQTQSFPAEFEGNSKSRIIPMIEALVYPYEMGLTDAVSDTGPYGDMIRLLRKHMDSILKPGICLDATSGAWKLTSSGNNTWQSKVYLAQFVTERILHLTDARVSGPVDQVHASFQILGGPQHCWSDQLDSRTGHAMGSLHYPRGVTSALWWMTGPDAEKVIREN